MVTKQEFWGGIEYINEDGKLHRLDGPAVEWKNGNKSWYYNGKLHRTDGPAIDWYDGVFQRYHLNDITYSKEDWENELLKLRLKRLKEL
jgi:hypothetical protein